MRPPEMRRPRPACQSGDEAKIEITPDHYTLPPSLLLWAIATGTGYGLILLVAVLGMAGFFDGADLITVPAVAEVVNGR